MPDKSQDQGVIATLVERFNTQRLPRALDMKARVDRGEVLGSTDLQYLSGLMEDLRDIKPLISRNPEYEPLVVKGMSLYKEITDKAIANAKK